MVRELPWSGGSLMSVSLQARMVDAVLVFDEAEGLFGNRSGDGGDGASRHDTQNVRRGGRRLTPLTHTGRRNFSFCLLYQGVYSAQTSMLDHGT
jgi:hypothetical protein